MLVTPITRRNSDGTAKLHCWTDASHSTLDNTHLSSGGAWKIAQQTKELGLTIGYF